METEKIADVEKMIPFFFFVGHNARCRLNATQKLQGLDLKTLNKSNVVFSPPRSCVRGMACMSIVGFLFFNREFLLQRVFRVYIFK
jgi:hypothetical protein